MVTQCLRSVVVSRSGVGGHLESGDVGEVHHLQHLLGLSINLNNILEVKQSEHVIKIFLGGK